MHLKSYEGSGFRFSFLYDRTTKCLICSGYMPDFQGQKNLSSERAHIVLIRPISVHAPFVSAR